MIPADIDNFYKIRDIAFESYYGDVNIEMEYLPREVTNLQKITSLWIRVTDPSLNILASLRKLKYIHLRIVGDYKLVTEKLYESSANIRKLDAQTHEFYIYITDSREKMGVLFNYLV